ncbi:MAG: glycine cleavage system aminomethyltransferase GcvT [Bacillota bacterium]
MEEHQGLKKTPLYHVHIATGAKIVEFGGWAMPVQYSGIIDEHKAVRSKAGLFDVSHMGELRLQGPEALKAVQLLITNDASRMQTGQIIYSPMCLDSGGVVDDLLVYRLGSEDFLLVVNASNTEKDLEWIRQHCPEDVTITDQSSSTAQLAIQGPLAGEILQRLTGVDLASIKYYRFAFGQVSGVECLISRTGYTGEDGFELYFDAKYAADLWHKIMAAGLPVGLVPIGLGARDTLRFEAGLPLYGQELSEKITPLEAGLGRFVKLPKEDFIGRQALLAQEAHGIPRKLVGLEMIDRGIPRGGYPVIAQGQEIGVVTSGTFAPWVGKNLAMALIRYGAEGDLEVSIRGRGYRCQIIPLPFYKR